MHIVLPEKQPGEKLDYSVDFSKRLGTRTLQSIQSSAVIRTDTGATVTGFLSTTPAPGFDATAKKLVFWLEDGVDGVQYKVTFKVLASDSVLLPELDCFITVRER